MKQIDTITVYTDGSYIKNKDDKGIYELCGYGIYFPNGELENVSKPFTNGSYTNNRAELWAIYESITMIINNFNFNKIYIYSDSEYCIKSITEYVYQWIKNNWKNSHKKLVENQDIIKPLHEIIQKYKEKIVFIHVRAHTKKNDEKSINNSIVDNLARNGANQSKKKYL